MSDLLSSFTNRVATWIAQDQGEENKYAELKSTLDFLEEHLFDEYVPTSMGHPKFRVRLAQWINSAETEEQQRLLYLMLSHLVFLGKQEMTACFQTAYSFHTMSWLIKSKQVNLLDKNAEPTLKSHVNETLFTAITDSFPVAEFIHLNNIGDHPHRFVWKQGLTNWDEVKFRQNILQGRKQLVILEDFVGSGSQAKKAIQTACSLSQPIDVLYCPMVICPAGAESARQLAIEYSNLSYSPVLELPPTSFIGETQLVGEPALFESLRTMLAQIHTKVAGRVWSKNYGPLGFKKTGSLVVKFDNCPNNTVPSIHHKSDSGWEPVFLRVDRE